MKRALVAMMAGLMLSPAAFGDEGKIDLRIGGGSARAWYSRGPSIASIPEAGFSLAGRWGPAAELGLELTFVLQGNASLVHSFGCVQKGTSLDWFFWEDRLGTQTYRLDSLEYSSFLKIGPFPRWGAYFLSGFAVSYVLSHRLIDGLASPPQAANLMGSTRRFDVGLLAGAGWELRFKRSTAFIELRYDWGLLDLSQGKGPLADYPVIKTRAFVLLAGMRFTIAKRPPPPRSPGSRTANASEGSRRSPRASLM